MNQRFCKKPHKRKQLVVFLIDLNHVVLKELIDSDLFPNDVMLKLVINLIVIIEVLESAQPETNFFMISAVCDNFRILAVVAYRGLSHSGAPLDRKCRSNSGTSSANAIKSLTLAGRSLRLLTVFLIFSLLLALLRFLLYLDGTCALNIPRVCISPLACLGSAAIKNIKFLSALILFLSVKTCNSNLKCRLAEPM